MYLSGLGVSVGDLPRAGRSLRLYTYDPIGSKFNTYGTCPPGNVYNTGHYDLALPGGPCSQSDPQGFCNWQDMSTYAGGRGEMLVLVTRDDLPTLCSAVPQAAVPAPARPDQSGGTFRIPIKGPETTPGMPSPIIVSSGVPMPMMPTPPTGGGDTGIGLTSVPVLLAGGFLLLLLARR